MKDNPISDKLAVRFRELRLGMGLTQDELAREIRNRVGFDWTRDTITAIEGRCRQISISELVYLPCVFGIGVEEILGVKLQTLEKCDLAARVGACSNSWSTGSAEEKAAKKFDVDVSEIVDASNKLWGRTLTDERDRRCKLESDTTYRSRQALRGHVTRKLLRELQFTLSGGTVCWREAVGADGR